MIRILQPGDEQLLEAFLLPRIDSSMFLLGNMRSSGLLDQGQPYQGTYVAAFEDEKIVSVVGHFGNGNLILQAPEQIDELCKMAVSLSKRGIKGLIGPHEQVEAVRAILDIHESTIQLDGEELLYSLPLAQLILPDILQTGQVQGRRINEDDLEVVSEWGVAYEIEALGEKDTPELRKDARSSMEYNCREGRTWILEEQGRPVARTSFNTTTKEAVQVGGVYTPPEFRGRGYGRAVVATSLRDAIADGAEKAILFTAKGNIAAQTAYEALGFSHIGTYHLLLLHSSITF